VKSARAKKNTSKAPRSARGRAERSAVVLMGSPGSGKTTLARELAQCIPLSIIEVGNLLKGEVQRGTKLGKTIKSFTSKGTLVPLVYVMKVVSAASRKAREKIVMFDGIPRSTEQITPFLEMLAEHGLTLRAVIVLTLKIQTALDRLVGRRICSKCGTLYNIRTETSKLIKTCQRCGGKLVQRRDDREEVVRERFKRFDDETMPVIEFFKNEFGELTWEQSATTPMPQRLRQVMRRLRKAIPHVRITVKQKSVMRPK
jgi:adenylate kinase